MKRFILKMHVVDSRDYYAKLISAQLHYPDLGFSPYKPMEDDSSFWTLDAGNDWKLKFSVENPDQLEIFHR